jgi:hypothetical protein
MNAAVPATFFGLSVAYLTVSGSTFPVGVPVGTLGKTQGTEWNDVEPANGTYDWAPLDGTIASARAAGIARFVYTFWSTPEWASSAPAQGCILTAIENVTGCAAPPAHINDWDSFVKAVVARYAGRIQYFELWNEANLNETFSGSVGEMVTMAQHAYADIKAIDPGAVVIAPSASRVGVLQYSPGCDVSECWLAEYFKAGGGAFADAVAYHPYACLSNDSACAKLSIACPQRDIQACAGSALTTAIADTRAIMADYGLSRLPLIATEGGFPSDIIGPGLLGSADEQTAYVSRWYVVQASQNVSLAVWFTEFRPENGLAGFGTSDALAEINQGYDQTYRWLVGSTMEGPCALADGVWTCPMVLASGSLAEIAFADSGQTPVQYTPPAGFSEYQELNGSVYQAGASMSVGMMPVLLSSSVSTTSSSATASPSTTPPSSSATTTSSSSASTTQATSSAPGSTSTTAASSASRSQRSQSALSGASLVPAIAALCAAGALVLKGMRRRAMAGMRR